MSKAIENLQAAQQRAMALSGTADVPRFDRDALILALRTDQEI
jgi:isopentenyl diphosphate isomerase/L-lactate dehydrogenase-like FMN-dependent dehydrogenase